MINKHLNVLHLFGNTDNQKVNQVANQRYENLLKELDEQNIKDYTIIGGHYDLINTKRAISKGHHLIVQLAKDRGFENVIIAEDDIQFTSQGAWKYFLSQIPKSYDLFFGLIYHGEIKENRVVNGFSGGMSLYVCHSRFYDTFLEQPIDAHVDRNLGNLCCNYEFKVIPEYCVTQRGGYSMNLKREMYYHEYLRDKKLYGVDLIK